MDLQDKLKLYRNNNIENANSFERGFSSILNDLKIKHERQKPFFHGKGQRRNFFLVDFYIPSMKTIIELDGKQHQENDRYDRYRDGIIRCQTGYTIIRVLNDSFTEGREYIMGAILFTPKDGGRYVISKRWSQPNVVNQDWKRDFDIIRKSLFHKWKNELCNDCKTKIKKEL